MRWLLANPLRTLPPLGLVAVGAIIGVAGFPVVKRSARRLAVMTVRGALTLNDLVKEAGGGIKRGLENMAERARPNGPLVQVSPENNTFIVEQVPEEDKDHNEF